MSQEDGYARGDGRLPKKGIFEAWLKDKVDEGYSFDVYGNFDPFERDVVPEDDYFDVFVGLLALGSEKVPQNMPLMHVPMNSARITTAGVVKEDGTTKGTIFDVEDYAVRVVASNECDVSFLQFDSELRHTGSPLESVRCLLDTYCEEDGSFLGVGKYVELVGVDPAEDSYELEISRNFFDDNYVRYGDVLTEAFGEGVHLMEIMSSYKRRVYHIFLADPNKGEYAVFENQPGRHYHPGEALSEVAKPLLEKR